MSRDLLTSILVEVLQAERSGAEHPRKESVRLGGAPPSRALREIAEDCSRSLEELRAIAARKEVGGAGERIGGALSFVRDRFGDLLVTREASYRGTLLGVHHGVDAIQLLMANAEYEKDVEIVEWCMRTLDRRRPLLERAQHALSWFGHNPDRAMEPAKNTLPSKAARVVASGLGVLGLRSR